MHQSADTEIDRASRFSMIIDTLAGTLGGRYSLVESLRYQWRDLRTTACEMGHFADDLQSSVSVLRCQLDLLQQHTQALSRFGERSLAIGPVDETAP